ncbi:MAG TPA: HAMP domain-containing sensor histidine kinase [Bacteroidales bacterium]|nr:HAMP domain-containing sensor histidine kinase [Bacteroidales bacterium]
MKRGTIKLIIIFSSLSLIGLIFTQLFWMKKAMFIAHKYYNHRATNALRDVVHELAENSDTTLFYLSPGMIQKGNEAAGQDSLQTFLLDSLLLRYIDYNRLDTEYGYTLVSINDGHVIYKKNDNAIERTNSHGYKICLNDVPHAGNTRLEVFFPEKQKHILLSLIVWFIMSGLFLLIVILSFAYIILTIIRQKKLSEMKNDFINNMTHEFKTPISTISLATEVLLSAPPKSSLERIKKYARIIYDENQRMRSQVEQVLQMAVFDKNEYKMDISQVDMHELIRNTVGNLCLEHSDKPVEVDYQFEAENHHIRADKLHITNMINNIVENAVKYSNSYPKIHITTSNPDANTFNVSFKDNGIGMSSETQKHIFDKFYRVHTGNVHTIKGFGLGLYYVKSIVEAHKGTINVKSELKKGSEFIVTMPVN